MHLSKTLSAIFFLCILSCLVSGAPVRSASEPVPQAPPPLPPTRSASEPAPKAHAFDIQGAAVRSNKCTAMIRGWAKYEEANTRIKGAYLEACTKAMNICVKTSSKMVKVAALLPWNKTKQEKTGTFVPCNKRQGMGEMLSKERLEQIFTSVSDSHQQA